MVGGHVGGEVGTLQQRKALRLRLVVLREKRMS